MYLSTRHLETAQTGFPNSRKLRPKWIGPYSIIRKVRQHAYELNIPPGMQLHPVFNTSSFKPYEQPSRHSQPQAVVLRDGSVGQLVEAITGKRKRLGDTQFQVRWVGEATPTWEPVENLHQVTGLIHDFERTKRRKRRILRSTRR